MAIKLAQVPLQPRPNSDAAMNTSEANDVNIPERESKDSSPSSNKYNVTDDRSESKIRLASVPRFSPPPPSEKDNQAPKASIDESANDLTARNVSKAGFKDVHITLERESSSQKDTATEDRYERKIRLASVPRFSPPPPSEKDNQAPKASLESNSVDVISVRVPVDETLDKRLPIEQKHHRHLVLILSSIFLFFLVAGAVVSTMVLMHKENDEAASHGDDASPETPQVSLQFQDEYLESICLFLLGPTEHLVLHSHSPQALAIEWLAYQDSLYLDVMSHPWRLLQRYALVTLYFANGGSLWPSLKSPSSGWVPHGVGVHECDWMFVDCNNQEEVVSLRLSGGGIVLTGALMTEIGHLPRLHHLSLANNRLEGNIPLAIYQLTDLVILDLSRNQFTSNISRRISALNQLQALVLDENYLSGDVPLDQMANLQQLEIVSLANNRALQGSLEQMLTMWPHLVELNVATTEISGSIPTQIGLLTNLQSLEMWHADLTGALPTELGNLKQLHTFVLGESPQLHGTLPTELGSLSNLQILKLNWVNVSGPLPTQLGQLTKLVDLELSGTELRGTLPTEWNSLTNLKSLDVSAALQITGTVPSEYGRMTSLKYIDLGGTMLGGTVGPEVCALEFGSFIADCRGNLLICDCCTGCNLGTAYAYAKDWDEPSIYDKAP